MSERLDALGQQVDQLTARVTGAAPGEREHDATQPHVVPAQQRGTCNYLLLAPDERVALHRQVVGPGIERLERREVGRQICDVQLKDVLDVLEVLEAMGAEVPHGDALRQAACDEGMRCLR